MDPTKTIVENASASKDHTMLDAAVKAAGLAETLSGPGPSTVFAPTNVAFAKLPAATVETLVKPENKATLTSILTHHVVPGTIAAADIAAKAKAKGGTPSFKNMRSRYTIIDAKGGTAKITIPNVRQSNAIAHVINTVLMPQEATLEARGARSRASS